MVEQDEATAIAWFLDPFQRYQTMELMNELGEIVDIAAWLDEVGFAKLKGWLKRN